MSAGCSFPVFLPFAGPVPSTATIPMPSTFPYVPLPYAAPLQHALHPLLQVNSILMYSTQLFFADNLPVDLINVEASKLFSNVDINKNL